MHPLWFTHAVAFPDANGRVRVEGRAGKGKSRLAIRWARRAAERGERVLLLCFNRPMAAIFERVFADEEHVTAGGFHDVALRLLAPTGFEVPREPDGDFWMHAVPTALLDHRDDLGDGFDTIILDEVQDIQSHWFLAIENLLDPAGAGRLYRLGDRHQNLYRADPEEAEGWTRFPLERNCRNTKAIAAVAESVGGGPPRPPVPTGQPSGSYAPGAWRRSASASAGSCRPCCVSTSCRRRRSPRSRRAPTRVTRSSTNRSPRRSSSGGTRVTRARWSARPRTG